MTYTENRTKTIHLSEEAFASAKYFQSQHQNNSNIGKQVYYNTLALWAVNYYCECMGIETDLERSDSLDMVSQTLLDTADLELSDLGKLECRYILPGDLSFYIPTEVWEDRIGYMVVEINEADQEGILRGFYPTPELGKMSEYLSLNLLLPLDEFLDHVERCKLGMDFLRLNAEALGKVNEVNQNIDLGNLANKIAGDFGTIWEKNGVGVFGNKLASAVVGVLQAIEPNLAKLVNNATLVSANIQTEIVEEIANFSLWSQGIFEEIWLQPIPWRTTRIRSYDGIVRSTLIELVTDETTINLTLIASVKAQSNQKREILLEICPIAGQKLPIGLKSQVIEYPEGDFRKEEETKNGDNIYFELNGKVGEAFMIKIEFGKTVITKKCVI